LVLLVGIFLAIVAFVLIAILLGNGGNNQIRPSAPPSTVAIVVAAQDIDLGATIQGTDLTTKDFPVTGAPADGYTDTSLVIGKVARAHVTSGQYISGAIVNGSGGTIGNVQVPAGLVGIAVQVDQISGVGTIVKPGDFVDVISGFTGPDNVPVVIPAASNAPGVAFTYVKVDDPLYNHATVKVLAPGLQVLGTLLPAPTTTGAEATPAPAPSGQPSGGGSTTLNGQQQIVILAATPQQAELIKFTQMSGSITLVLRSAQDCTTEQPGASAEPSAQPSLAPGQYCPVIPTTGITLRRAVDDYGVLPPQVVQVVLPSPLPGTAPRRSPAP